jgi:hypothetical protein
MASRLRGRPAEGMRRQGSAVTARSVISLAAARKSSPIVGLFSDPLLLPRESGSVASRIKRHPRLARRPPWSDQCAAATRHKHDRR